MAITLGLVEAVDSNGVYVSMPGSRGVLRGPYRSLSTVAVGTTVLVAATDDGEYVVAGAVPAGYGAVSVLSFGAVGDGATDDTAAIQAAVSAGAGGTVWFPSGYTFRITDGIVVQDETTLLGEGATIRQDTKHKPCLDIIAKDDVTVRGLSFTTTPARTYTGGASVRDADVYAMWTGVYASGERLTVQGCRFSGFTAGINLNTWDGSDTTTVACSGARVLDCVFDDNDFGILASTVTDCEMRGISGAYSLQTGSPNPPHLIYVSQSYLAGDNTNVTIDGVHGWDSAEGHCVQVKYTVGGLVANVHAVGCAGVLSVQDSSHLQIVNVAASSDESPDVGSLYMQTGCSDVVIDGLSVATASPTPSDARLGRITGERITATNLAGITDWSAQYEGYEWLVDGDDIFVDGVTSHNASAYGGVVVGVSSTSVNCHVSNVTAVNCRAGVQFESGATGSAFVNRDRIVNGNSITSPFKVYTDTGVTSTLLGDKPTVTGSRGGNAALASLLTQLAGLGLITDSSS